MSPPNAGMGAPANNVESVPAGGARGAGGLGVDQTGGNVNSVPGTKPAASHTRNAPVSSSTASKEMKVSYRLILSCQLKLLLLTYNIIFSIPRHQVTIWISSKVPAAIEVFTLLSQVSIPQF